jgi:hypothetical protein
MKQKLFALLSTAMALPISVSAQSGSAAVSGLMSVYQSGGNVSDDGGISPFLITLNPGTGRVLTFSSVTGTASFCVGGACATPSPDGPAIGGTNLTSAGSISGILAPTSGFLAGVFLGPSLPAGAPPSMDFNTITTDFLSIAPLLGHTFFIGDGRTSLNVMQQFLIPDGATRLYLGVADGFNFFGPPDFYEDNAGGYTANYSVSGAITAVPEPASFILTATGLGVLLVMNRRRRK